MKTALHGLTTGVLASVAIALATAMSAQSTPQSNTPATPTAQPSTPGDQSAPANPTTTQQGTSAPAAQPAPGTAPVASDTPPPPPQDTKTDKKDKKDKKDKASKDDPEPGTTPVAGDVAAKDVDPEKVVPVGGDMIKVKPGSVEDVGAVGNREIGGRGLGNWYSTDSEIKMGKMYADQIEKSTRFITDPDHHRIRQPRRAEHRQELRLQGALHH